MEHPSLNPLRLKLSVPHPLTILSYNPPPPKKCFQKQSSLEGKYRAGGLRKVAAAEATWISTGPSDLL